MKKLFSILMLTALVFSISSCGSDDDVTPEKVSYASVEATYTLEFPDTMINICNITAKYTNENGETASEAVTAATWKKVVKINKAASNLNLEVWFAKKDGVDYTENSPYTSVASTGEKFFRFCVNGGKISAVTYDTKGSVIANIPIPMEQKKLSVTPDKIETFFERYSQKYFNNATLDISDDGKYSGSSI